jgi:serine/threonine protein kinase
MSDPRHPGPRPPNSETRRPDSQETSESEGTHRKAPTTLSHLPLSPSPVPEPEERFPRPFGRYTLRSVIGEGGMGKVYLADDTRLDIEVALKIPHAHLLHHPMILERFYAEARALARLHHPNLCRVFDVNEFAGIHYLTMGYVDGQPLEPRPDADAETVIDLVRKLALALAEAHDQGVIHRDLKPRNILLTRRQEPVVVDFGLALKLGTQEHLTDQGVIVGTVPYMGPEQVLPDHAAVGPVSDVYSLGVILFELLTGTRPFLKRSYFDLRGQILWEPAPAPSARRPGLDLRLDAICLRALAKRSAERFAGMREFAAALAGVVSTVQIPVVPPRPVPMAPRPLVPREAIRFAFAGLGERAPAFAGPQDRLFLDVGNDLRPGVIDHHHRADDTGSTARSVLEQPGLLDGAVNPHRTPDAPFTIVLHEKPDLDCLASAYLAIAYLTTGQFPDEARVLARYVDKVDQGAMGLSLADPFSLYAAYLQLTNRVLKRPGLSDPERWQECVRGGLAVVAYVMDVMAREGTPLPAVDAFTCPGLFGPEDRQEVQGDIERYQRKLADPQSHARRVRLRLPGQLGGRVTVEGLLVRDVQNAGDPDRCVFFKDWARTDAARCPNGRGYVALSVFHTESHQQARRCILSVTPDSGASLQGLAALLDQEEAERRRSIFSVDDRVTDPTTGAAKPPRTGYTNADPWYDGRAHSYTIVDAPRAGTKLTADEIEALFLRFGGSEAAAEPLAR